MLIVDAHLDLSYNALHGQDVLKPARGTRGLRGPEIPTVGLPDLRAGGRPAGLRDGFHRAVH